MSNSVKFLCTIVGGIVVTTIILGFVGFNAVSVAAGFGIGCAVTSFGYLKFPPN